MKVFLAVCIISITFLLESGASLAAPAGQSGGPPRPVPGKALILGVPFVDWGEASGYHYPNSGILNPSFAACQAMSFRYWGQNLELLKQPDKVQGLIKSGSWVESSKLDGGAIEEVKALVARGIPVAVHLALTPVAHPLNPAVSGMIAIGAVKGISIGSLDRNCLNSGAFGRMIPLDLFSRLDEQIPSQMESSKEEPEANAPRFRSINESALLAERLIVGYDDERQVVIVHDPLFGPACEISYGDFGVMWTATGQGFSAQYPSNYVEVVAKRPPSAPYRPRTAAQQAAQGLVMGYALASVGKGAEALDQYNATIAVPGIGKGYTAMILVETAIVHSRMKQSTEAIATAQQATATLPELSDAWSALAQIYRESPLEDRESKAGEAEKRAKKLSRDRSAEQVCERALPQDLLQWAGMIRGGLFTGPTER